MCAISLLPKLSLSRPNVRNLNVKKGGVGFRCSALSFASDDVWHCTLKKKVDIGIGLDETKILTHLNFGIRL